MMTKQNTATAIAFPLFRKGKPGTLMVALLDTEDKEVSSESSASADGEYCANTLGLAVTEAAILSLNMACMPELESGQGIDLSRLTKYTEAIASFPTFTVNHTNIPKLQGEVKIQKLTRRELELIKLLWSGYTTTQIAAIWHRSALTVTKHRENMNHKFGHKLSPQGMSYILTALTALESL